LATKQEATAAAIKRGAMTYELKFELKRVLFSGHPVYRHQLLKG